MSEDNDILNLQEAADYLGVSSKTFQRVLKDTDVPARKVGREWKFSRKALSEWIGRGHSRDFHDSEDEAAPGGVSPASEPPPRIRLKAQEFSAEED